MECERWSIKEDVPPALSSIITASAAFYTISCPLYSQERVQRHTLCATKQGQVVEVGEGDNIIRSVNLTPTEVSKIMVHHEFEPRQLYVVLLYRTNKAVVLLYNDFRVVYECDGVASVSSEDLRATGVPQLHFTHLSGTVEVIPSRRLLSMSGQRKGEEAEENQQRKREAVDALAKRLRSGMRHVEQLQGQRRAKERYIQGMLSALRVHLARQNQDHTTTLMPALSLLGEKCQEKTTHPPLPQPPKPQSSHPPPLKILGVRQKLVHDKWVIGVNVVNEGERVVVHSPYLMLCAGCGADILAYRSCTLKSVRRGPHSSSDDPPHHIHTAIEPLHPPILRPGKRACVLAICEMPAFVSGPTVTFSGLLTYTCRSLRTRHTQSVVPGDEEEGGGKGWGVEVQTSIGVVQIDVGQLASHQISLDKDPVPGGVSFSSVALVAGSITSQVSLTTLFSPLTDIITRIMQRYTLTKVHGLSDFYCFSPDQPHPLRHSAFTLILPHAHRAHLTLYTRDKTQALMVIHSILCVLPSDISVEPHRDRTIICRETEKLHNKLLSKMSEAASKIIEGCGMQLKKNQRKKARLERRGKVETPKKESPKPRDARMARQQEASRRFSEFVKEQEEFNAREGPLTFSSEDYVVWRGSLKDIQFKMDRLYIKCVDLNSV